MGKSERERDVQRKRSQSLAAREVKIPKCADRRRRNKLEKDDFAWLQFYCADLFWYEFTVQQREMISAIAHAIKFGGDQALAASRGEGKTKIFERTVLKYVLSGTVHFAVLLAATGSRAEDSLDSIKQEIETNERLLADYPEVCVPVRSLENTPNRAHYQIVTGWRHDNGKVYCEEPSRFKWCGQEIYLPNVPGAPAAGAIIATRGLDAEVRGLNKKDRRPDIVGIDDPDTEETVRSTEQAAKLEARIDRGISGLGGQQRTLGRVMLTTLQNRQCVSFRFTDRAQKPSWQGRRFRFLITPPERVDLWEEYVQLRQIDLQEGDRYARRAHAFYLKRRKLMDAGAEVANPHRFDGRELPDRTQAEVSALQRYYNEVARLGADAVACEYDNDPPEESGPQDAGITPHRIQRQLNGLPRRIVPPGTTLLTQGIDVHKSILYWVVRAWKSDCTGATIDYGISDVLGTVRGSDEGVEPAIIRALRARYDEVEGDPYTTPDGEIRDLSLTLVDARYMPEAVLASCAATPQWMGAMGFGRSAGCVAAHFSPPLRPSKDKKPGGAAWYLARRLIEQTRQSVWIVHHLADTWKNWEHARWLTDPRLPGSLTLWGDPSDRPDRLSPDEKSHFAYAKHITAEVEVEELVKGVLTRRFRAKSDANHWGDASVLADVAAAARGISLLRRPAGTPPPAAAPRHVIDVDLPEMESGFSAR